MKTQHTPGPWKFGSKTDGDLYKRNIAGVDGYHVAAVSSRDDHEVDANARLIAAAPDLLEALQDLFDADMEHVLMGDGKDDQIEAIAKARAAIAKATGAV
jgi:hypothetical protein